MIKLTNEKYAEICLQYGDMLYGIMSKFPHLREDWKSLKNVAILMAYTHYDSNKSKFITYLHTCMYHECVKASEYLQAIKRGPPPMQLNEKWENFKVFGESHRINREKVNREIKDLPLEVLNEKERAIIELKIEGYTGEEIAEKTGWGVSPQRIKQIFYSACEKLRLASKYLKYRRHKDYPVFSKKTSNI